MSNIVRVKKNANYVVMNKTALQDKSLSWKAKGIMAYMLSMPDDWTFYMNELTKHATDGEKSFRAGFKELSDRGYVKRFPVREGNRIVSWETIVHEVPVLADFVQVQNEDVGNVHLQNDTLLSNDLELSNERLSNDIKIPFVEIVDYLNRVSSKKFRASSENTKSHIRARWKEGHRLEDFKHVIDVKCAEWKNDDMQKYIRPQTLFGTKFESYLNQKTKKDTYPYEEWQPKEWERDGAYTERPAKEYDDGINF